MTKRAVARQRLVGEHLLKVTVEVSVMEKDALCCGLFCPYQVDTDKPK
jgi:hypothetical protein